MVRRKFYKIFSLILALCLGGAGLSPAYGDCTSPCCPQSGCQPRYERATPETCHLVDIFLKEIRGPSCTMAKACTPDGAQDAAFVVSRIERPAASVYSVLSYESRPFSEPAQSRFQRVSVLPRAAPESLYLQNLTLLI